MAVPGIRPLVSFPRIQPALLAFGEILLQDIAGRTYVRVRVEDLETISCHVLSPFQDSIWRMYLPSGNEDSAKLLDQRLFDCRVHQLHVNETAFLLHQFRKALLDAIAGHDTAEGGHDGLALLGKDRKST